MKNSRVSEVFQLENMSKKIGAFWMKVNNSYPFAFKQSKLKKTDRNDIPFIVIEKFQYNFKRVNPNYQV